MWFVDNTEICSYVTDRTDERMSHSVVDPVSVDAIRQWKHAKVFPGCMMGHTFVYTPHSSNVVMEEFLCDCESCLLLIF